MALLSKALEILADADIPGAQVVAKRILQSLSGSHLLQGHKKNVVVGVSIGIAVKSKPNEAATALIEAADTALLSAKRKGRGQYFFSRPKK